MSSGGRASSWLDELEDTFPFIQGLYVSASIAPGSVGNLFQSMLIFWAPVRGNS